MENNKYYTPTIEEFHVGFEYEYLTINDTWIKDIFNSIKPEDTEQMDFEIVKKICLNTPNEIRVKYLDQEDIESLGWKDCDNIYNTIRWNFNDYILMFYKKDNRYLIFRDCGPNNIQTVFNGFIKNKSELIKLQQQLNIINYDNK